MKKPEVVFFFGDPVVRGSGYQLTQWIQPLQRLSSAHPVTIVLGDSGFLSKIPPHSGVQVVVCETGSELDEFFVLNRPAVILYPNQYYRNFKALSYSDALHVFVSHGESDKQYMSERGLTAFDFLFLAGEVAKQRVERDIPEYPADRIRLIGRPQLLDEVVVPSDIPPTSRKKTVLYAPTWEGGKPFNRYGSVYSHGVTLVEQILDDPQLRLIYRPHPFTGNIVPEWGNAHRSILGKIREANNRDATANHFHDKSVFGWQLGFADLMISDVSAVAYDWLATGKPIILTRPAEREAVLPSIGIFAEFDLLDANQAPEIRKIIGDALHSGDLQDRVGRWSKKYYSPTLNPETGHEVFVDEISALIKLVRESRTVSEERVAHRRPLTTTGVPAHLVGLPGAVVRWLGKKTRFVIRTFIPERTRSKLTTKVVARSYRILQDVANSGKPLVIAEGPGSTIRAVREASLLFGPPRDSQPLMSMPIIAIASLHSYFLAQLVIRLGGRKNLSREEIVYLRTAESIKRAIIALRPRHVFYNQLSPRNHFGFRNFATQHVLLWPERFGESPNHNLLPYDIVVSDSPRFIQDAQQKVFWVVESTLMSSDQFISVATKQL